MRLRAVAAVACLLLKTWYLARFSWSPALGCHLQLLGLLYFHSSDAHLLRTLVFSRYATSGHRWVVVFILSLNGAQLHRLLAAATPRRRVVHAVGALFWVCLGLVATLCLLRLRVVVLSVVGWLTQWSRLDGWFRAYIVSRSSKA